MPGASIQKIATAAGCSKSTAQKYMQRIKEEGNYVIAEENEEDKPAGLFTVTHPKEQAIRQEQEREQQREAASAASKPGRKNLFSWLHDPNRAKREKEQLRSKPFSEREAEEIRAPLQAALFDYFKYMDELIYATHKAHRQVAIWSSIDDEEAGLLVDAWLSRARRDARAASHITFAVERHSELQVGIILLPRFYQTFRAYVDGGGFSVR